MSKLDILVPRHNETFEEISNLLNSLLVQQSVDLKNDLKVIICDDGSDDNLSKKFKDCKIYPFSIKYFYREENKGVSYTRNEAFEKSTADYVMFCDADDMFFNACGLYILFREMDKEPFNALTSVFLEETRFGEKKEIVYINHNVDSTFVHGKVYRRQYLEDNNIRWNPKLTIHEDSYFNCLAQRCAGDVKFCPNAFYLWKWRDASVCRHDPKYILKTYNNMLDSNTELVNEFVRRGRMEDARFFVCNMIYDAYFTMNKDEWINQKNKIYRRATELRFKKYYSEFEKIYKSIDEKVKAQIIVGIKNRMFGEGLFMESITFDQWISHIKKLK